MQAFCDRFKTAEQKGVWPQQLVEGKVVCLAKVAQPAGAHDFRPITIFGLLYRCWSTWHAKATLQALEDTLPGGSLREPAWPLCRSGLVQVALDHRGFIHGPDCFERIDR